MSSLPSPEEAANVEVVRQGIEAFNNGDFEAMLKLGDGEDFEYDWSRSLGPNRGIYRGVEGLMESSTTSGARSKKSPSKPTSSSPAATT
jgi:hypothetical protein